jgi:hypothetical protein
MICLAKMFVHSVKVLHQFAKKQLQDGSMKDYKKKIMKILLFLSKKIYIMCINACEYDSINKKRSAMLININYNLFIRVE